MPNSASHSRTAFSRIASNTGTRLPADALMTPKTSTAAASRSRAAASSISSASIRACISAKDERNAFFGPPRTGLLALCLISRASEYRAGINLFFSLFSRATSEFKHNSQLSHPRLALPRDDLDHHQAPGAARLIARGAEFHQQFLTRQLHRRQLLEPRPQPLQLAPPHCPLLGNAVAALRQNVELAFLRQQLDLHAGSRLLPRLSDQMLLQARQAALRRAHQVMHRRVGSAHLVGLQPTGLTRGEHLLRLHAAVQQPDPTRLAVCPLDS